MKCLGWTVLSVMTVILSSHRTRGQKCSADEECAKIVNGTSICINNTCDCYPNNTLVTVSDKLHCVTAFNETGGECFSNQQCSYKGGKCSAQGKCACDIKHYEDSHGCSPYVKSFVVPLAVGVSIGVSVLVTLCIYLWLSRRKK